MKTLFSLLLLLFSHVATATAPDNFNQCITFNQIALQLALAQSTMPAPITLNQMQSNFGTGEVAETSALTTYTWNSKEQILIVKAKNNDITDKLLIGNNDGTAMARKLALAYEQLKNANSIWTVSALQNQLGPATITQEKIEKQSWHCGIGTIELTTNKNNIITTAAVGYEATNQADIEAIAGANHPSWNIQTDLFGKAYRGWHRVFTTSY